MEFLRRWYGRPQQWNYFAFIQTALEDGSGDICMSDDRNVQIDEVCTSCMMVKMALYLMTSMYSAATTINAKGSMV